MASRKTHLEDCQRLIGDGYDHVHRWLDSYAKQYPPPLYLEYHRQFRHTKAALNKQFKAWNPNEILAAKIHIIRDYEIYVLSKSMSEVKIEEIDGLYDKTLQYLHIK